MTAPQHGPEAHPAYRGISGGTVDGPTLWYRLELFGFARTKPDWLTIPEGLEVCQAMPE